MTGNDEIAVQIRVWQETGESAYREYVIPVNGEMNVLNVLEYVHEHLDPAVSYKSSCRRGVCGACAMTINGKRCLACETVAEDGVTIDPFEES